MDLDRLFNFGAESAQHLFLRQGELLPVWAVLDEKDCIKILVVAEMTDKDAVAEKVKEFIKKQKATAYVSAIEAWVVEIPKGGDMPREIKEGRSLKHNPDRRELINILAEDNQGNSVSGCYYILRPEHGKPKLSPLKVFPKATKTEGRFTNMFA